ncbi:MAG: sigma-70 family RNA polymerase sigma factor [Saprospiraceae bacterium]|jgi:RNA polymerase sigma factor (sigma-70 family)|nr:sigma-70 family RNA polymerase sigma factor [Saprospiraceae bacterium]MBK7795929.1 sigma-70 family RNA polymerase sigma factor [Saprospiraceae bacterium]MBL0261042.1 sigma-70 family RNA polymerase sigma factor [Saprospiraceae bacterium]
MSEILKPSLGEIIKKYRGQLFSFIKGKTRSTEDAEDILQEVWYQFSKITNLSELENISAWLFSVSRNKITDLYRKRKTESLEEMTFQDEDGDFQIKELLLLDESQNPEWAHLKDLLWVELFKALDELPENQRLVFIENEMEEKTLKQIADEQSENIKTIISRKSYAIKHLRKRLYVLYNELLKN